MKLLKPTVDDYGLVVEHDMPCAVHPKEHAVFQGNSGVFLPSWKAQREGWMIIKVPKWLKRFLKRFEPGTSEIVDTTLIPTETTLSGKNTQKYIKHLFSLRDKWEYEDENKYVEVYPRPLVFMLNVVEQELNRLREKAGEQVEEKVGE